MCQLDHNAWDSVWLGALENLSFLPYLGGPAEERRTPVPLFACSEHSKASAASCLEGCLQYFSLNSSLQAQQMPGIPWAKYRRETLRRTPGSSCIENRSFIRSFTLLPNIYWQAPTSTRVWPFRNPQFQWKNQCQNTKLSPEASMRLHRQRGNHGTCLFTLALPGENQR